MDTTKNLFIIFHPGTGGNHLTNLISLSDQYYREIDYSKYEYDNHNGYIHAHFHDNSLDYTCAYKRKNIFGIHLPRFVDYVNGRYINSQFPPTNDKNIQILFITIPPINIKHLAFNRFCKWNNWANQGGPWQMSSFQKLRLHYSQEHIEKIIPNITAVHNINSELLFSSDIDHLIQDIETKLDIKILDKDLACSIHQKWIEQLMLE